MRSAALLHLIVLASACGRSEAVPARPVAAARLDTTVDSPPRILHPRFAARVAIGALAWRQAPHRVEVVALELGDGGVWSADEHDSVWASTGNLVRGEADFESLFAWSSPEGVRWVGYDRGVAELRRGLWTLSGPAREVSAPRDPWGRAPVRFNGEVAWSRWGDLVELALGASVDPRRPPASEARAARMRVWRGDRDPRGPESEVSADSIATGRYEDSVGVWLRERGSPKWLSPDSIAVVHPSRHVIRFWVLDRRARTWMPQRDSIIVPTGVPTYDEYLTSGERIAADREFARVPMIRSVWPDRHGVWWAVVPVSVSFRAKQGPNFDSWTTGVVGITVSGRICRFWRDSEGPASVRAVVPSPDGRALAVLKVDPGSSLPQPEIWVLPTPRCRP